MILTSAHLRLEPLMLDHVEPLAAASAANPESGDPDLYRWTLVPQGADEVARYIRTALQWQHDGTAVPFAVVRLSDNRVIGSTRYYNMERWSWPSDHPRHGNPHPDVCEIGWTWYTRSAVGTGVNPEVKCLMLTHAFEVWKMLRICFHTDSRNTRSQAAMERIGLRREGVLRVHKLANGFDSAIRDSVRYSILAAEWPEAKARLVARLDL